jgi:amino acid transporter
MFFACWSWVGFESAAMYGEESKNPSRSFLGRPCCRWVGIGIFYVVVRWAALTGR